MTNMKSTLGRNDVVNRHLLSTHQEAKVEIGAIGMRLAGS